MKHLWNLLAGCFAALTCFCCSPKTPDHYTESAEPADIYPDYAEVTVPPNIAPLRFVVDEKADAYAIRIRYPDGEWITETQEAKPEVDEWHDMTAKAKGHALDVEIYVKHDDRWTRRKPFRIHVAREDIDPYLSYRLISPSYVAYHDLTICQRNLTNFDEQVVYGNRLNMGARNAHCINCHSFQGHNPSRMQFHVREAFGGTVIACDGKVTKVNLKTDSLISAGVYPAWHPQERLIAYSVNQTGQTFHTLDLQKVEVQDMRSDLILYDIDRNEVTRIPGRPDEMEVFPTWSPDGKYLYYASARFVRKDSSENLEEETIRRYKEIRYDLYRRRFDPARRTVDPVELVVDASAIGKSATRPRTSPDGRYLVSTMGAYGVFHIWHKDADLYLTDLHTQKTRPMTEINSGEAESGCAWSSNGRWLVFGSRRNDGNYTRPFIAYIGPDGRGRKPFELPQEIPDKHRNFMRSYNIPEFMNGPVDISPQAFAAVIRETEAKPARLAR